MRSLQEIEAAVLDLMTEMEGDLGDAHEFHMRLRQTIEGMRAMGMPVPDDLAHMEKELSAEFASDAKGSDRAAGND
jgi:hypothetical protein